MTNGEYLEHKLNDWFAKYHKFIYILCLVLDVLFLVFVLKVNTVFLALFIPWTMLCFAFTWALINMWLEEEHKEKNENDKENKRTRL